MLGGVSDTAVTDPDKPVLGKCSMFMLISLCILTTCLGNRAVTMPGRTCTCTQTHTHTHTHTHTQLSDNF